jgi:hypothetical protein
MKFQLAPNLVKSDAPPKIGRVIAFFPKFDFKSPSDINFSLYVNSIPMCDIDSPYEIIDPSEIPQVSGEEIPVYTDKELDKVSKNCDESIVMFDMKTYLENIWASYKKNKDKIMHQFKLDFPRHSIYVNSSLVSDIDIFYKQLQSFNLKRCMDLMIEDLQLLTIMLCNQSSFELPFHLLNKIYTEESKQIFLTYKRGHDNIVRINSYLDYISFEFETRLRVIDVADGKELYCVPIKLFFDIPDTVDKIQTGICNWKMILENKNLD